MADPRITVYIASHNYGQFLGDSIESVLRQTVDDWELLIIDDNSTDNTAEVMALYKHDPRIRLFSTPGIGLPAVCNLALREARGEYLIRLDGDDVFDENILLVLGNTLDQNAAVALVFPDYYLVDEHGEVFAQERRRKIYATNHLVDLPPNGACTLVRKDIVEKLGGYREDLGAQDGFDLWSKIRTQYKCENINLPLFYYRRHDRNLTNNFHRLQSARRQIKKDAILAELTSFRPFTAVIPCRKYYDFQADLWQQEINGKSLLQRDIEVCLSSAVLDYVVVACDNREAAAVVNGFADARLRFVLRNTKDTIRSKSLVPTLAAMIEPLDPAWNGVTILSYIQTPFVTKDTLEEAIYTLVMNGADSSFGVQEIRRELYRRTPHGLETINPPGELSSDFDMIYQEAKTSLATRNKNLRTGSLTGPSIVSFVVSSEESFFINTDQTLQIARMMAADKVYG